MRDSVPFHGQAAREYALPTLHCGYLHGFRSIENKEESNRDMVWLPSLCGKAADPFHFSAALQKLAHQPCSWRMLVVTYPIQSIFFRF